MRQLCLDSGAVEKPRRRGGDSRNDLLIGRLYLGTRPALVTRGLSKQNDFRLSSLEFPASVLAAACSEMRYASTIDSLASSRTVHERAVDRYVKPSFVLSAHRTRCIDTNTPLHGPIAERGPEWFGECQGEVVGSIPRSTENL